MRGETPFYPILHIVKTISIHSPHARGDQVVFRHCSSSVYFNPLPSCEGRRKPKFSGCKLIDFNPLPSCEGRLARLFFAAAPRKFQSTPLMRGETISQASMTELPLFQSTPLMRGETDRQTVLRRSFPISIHSPHARGDIQCRCSGQNF